MSLSLRKYGEQRLAKMLGTTSAAIYERQRSLVRVGLLELAGRGRGGGTKATPRNVALLLLAYMASDSPSDAGDRAQKLAAMSAQIPARTYRLTLLDCIERTLEDAALAEKFTDLVISRTSLHAEMLNLTYDTKNYLEFSASRKTRPFVSIDCHITGPILLAIAWDMQRLWPQGKTGSPK